MRKRYFSLFLLLLLYFSLGLMSGLNNLLTPIFKQMFHVSYFQANLVPGAFFSACCIGALVYLFLPKVNLHFLTKLSYAQLILLGIVFLSLGCFIFIPAAIFKNYYFFLIGLFIIGLGFTYIQISLTPSILLVTEEKQSIGYLNLAGGINSLATTISPFIGTAIFINLFKVEQISANIKYPYLILGLMFIILLIIMHKYLKITDLSGQNQNNNKIEAWNYKQLRYGMLAIFLYVGAEATIGNNLITYLESPLNLSAGMLLASKLLAFYWGGAMVGRFLYFVAQAKLRLRSKITVMIVLTVGFTLVISIMSNIWDTSYFLFNLVIASLLMVLIKNLRYTLMCFCALAIFNTIIASTLSHSEFAIWSLISIGIANSIMWPGILNLALKGLGAYRKQASSLLILMVSGGAAIPLGFGLIADGSNIKHSFLFIIICYSYIFFYSNVYHKLIKN